MVGYSMNRSCIIILYIIAQDPIFTRLLVILVRLVLILQVKKKQEDSEKQ